MKIYQGTIQYAKYSSYMFSDANLDKVSKLMQEGIKYYQGNSETIREATIEALCDKCFNTGEIKLRKGLITRIKPCACQKQFVSERIEVKIPVLV